MSATAGVRRRARPRTAAPGEASGLALLATASHELRTPLTTLQLRLELLERHLQDERVDLRHVRDEIGLAHLQAVQMGRLARDLLELSRIDGSPPPRRDVVAIGPLTRAVLDEFAGLPGPALALDAAGAGLVRADRTAVAQIVRLLVDNARRYGALGAAIRVHVGRRTIAIEDDGPGIAADERELIFERFQRGSSSHGHTGCGLGLAIGRALARRMGGELRLSSSREPTRFELLLPAAADRRADAAATQSG